MDLERRLSIGIEERESECGRRVLELRVEAEVDPLRPQPLDQEPPPAIPCRSRSRGQPARPRGRAATATFARAPPKWTSRSGSPAAGGRIGSDQVDQTLAEADQRLPGFGRSHQREDRFCGMPTPIHERYVEVDGIRTFVRERAGEGPPTVFVHGNPTHSADWLPFLDAMDGPAIAFDLPGFGRSERPAGDRFDYAMGSYGRFAGALLDDLTPGPFNLVVHDWGAVALLSAQERASGCPAARRDQRRPLNRDYRWHWLARVWRRRGLGEAFNRIGSRVGHRADAAPRQARPQADAAGVHRHDLGALRRGHAAGRTRPLPLGRPGGARGRRRASRSPGLSGPGRLGEPGPLHLASTKAGSTRRDFPRDGCWRSPKRGIGPGSTIPRRSPRSPDSWPRRTTDRPYNRTPRAPSVCRNRAPAAAGVDRPPAPVRPLLPRLPGLSARARIDRRKERPRLRQRRADRRSGEEPRDVLRAGVPAGGLAPRLDHRHRQLALRQLATSRSPSASSPGSTCSATTTSTSSGTCSWWPWASR